MADVKALVDFTVEQTSVGVGDLLYVASAGTPAKVTFANLVDNNYTYSATMTVTGTIDVTGGALDFGGTQDFVPKADANGNLVDGFGVETSLTDDDTKLATSGGVFDHVKGALKDAEMVAYAKISGFSGTPTYAFQSGFDGTIVDIGTGRYTLNFASAEASADYFVFATATGTNARFYTIGVDGTPATSGFSVGVTNQNGTNSDADMFVMVWRQ
ncbi:hypothetical protein [Ruegeria sp. HKCCD6109]|uniref:hypothetical protein n=1 Tax=Ruegeria sp. HKCCD6109 TaxID=2683017 RepID=UPI001492359F|nr:hypothetical protein [Ruegeria sp. HKCCD6109]NOD65743.1 hypothetical protein [Ruegeria sp. HKCCD6109]